MAGPPVEVKTEPETRFVLEGISRVAPLVTCQGIPLLSKSSPPEFILKKYVVWGVSPRRVKRWVKLWSFSSSSSVLSREVALSPHFTNPEVSLSVIQEIVKEVSVMFEILTSFGANSAVAPNLKIFWFLAKSTPAARPRTSINKPIIVGILLFLMVKATP